MLTKKRKEEIIDDLQLSSGHSNVQWYKITFILKPVVIELLSLTPLDVNVVCADASGKEAKEIAIKVAEARAFHELITQLETFHHTAEWLRKHIKKSVVKVIRKG